MVKMVLNSFLFLQSYNLQKLQKIHIIEISIPDLNKPLNTLVDLFVDVAAMELDRYENEENYPKETLMGMRETFLALLRLSVSNFNELKMLAGIVAAEENLASGILRAIFSEGVLQVRTVWESLEMRKRQLDTLVISA